MNYFPKLIFNSDIIEKSLLVAFVLLYPFFLKVSLFILVCYIIYSSVPFTLNVLKPKQFNFVALLSLVLYLLYFGSLLYTQNLEHGLKDLETKAGLIIFPLLVIFLPRTHNDKYLFMHTFIAAFLIAVLVCFLRSLYLYSVSQEVTSFYYDYFSFLMHPTYFTIHLSMALIFHLHFHSELFSNRGRTVAILSYLVLFIFVTAIYLASSRAGMVIGFFTAMMFLIVRFATQKFNSTKDLVVVGLMIIAVVFMLSPSSSRFGILVNELLHKESETVQNQNQPVDINPISHRLLLYKSAVTLTLQNPFGVGVGDVQDELVQEYERIGYEKAITVRYNPHNQYLQTAVGLGFIGLVLLMAMFSLLMKNFVKDGSLSLSAAFGLIIALNSLFESTLEVQRGVLFFSIMLFFLFSMEKSARMLK